jgi:hypothetical protein
MKTAIRWTLLLALCAVLLPGAVSAQLRDDAEFGPRFLEKGTVIFDGVEFAPGEFERPDRALTWVVTKEDAENGTIHVFSSPDVAGVFMNRVMDKQFGKDRGKGLKLATAAACTYTPTTSLFNKNPGCGGSTNIYLSPGSQYTELDSISWNNSISCVKAACVNAWTTLYSCRNFQLTTGSNCNDPDALFVGSGNIISDLNDWGFNNRTSSIRFCTVYPTCS